MPKKKDVKMPKSELYAAKSTIFIPANKQSAWVYKKGTKIVKDSSKKHQGLWSFPGYTIERESPVEVWVFRDNDPEPIEESVLSNNPLQGVWGYVNDMEDPRHPKPEEMIFYPPDSSHPNSFRVRGVWVKPMYKRDMSALAPNTTGFMKMSDAIEAKGPRGVGGTWKVLGSNQIKGRDKNLGGDDDDHNKNRWTIYIRRPRGKRETFPLSVIPGNRLSQVKEKIEDEKGIPVENQRLFFEGEPLKDEKTLVGSGVRNGDTIDLGPMDIFVRTPRGKKFKFEVDPREMVEDVKKMAKPKIRMPVQEQRLRFKRVHVNDGNPISKYGITHGSVLDLARMVIFVEPLHSWGLPTVELDVDKTDTIKSVKTKVKNRIRIPPEEQNLFFKETYLDKMMASLEEYNIKHMDILVMQDKTPDNPLPVPRVSKPSRTNSVSSKPSDVSDDESDSPARVNIKRPNGRTFLLEIDPENDTIDDVKQEVGKKIGKPPRQFTLINDDTGEPVPGNKIPIPNAHYSIGPPPDHGPIEVQLRRPNGRVFTLLIDPESEIDDVKQKAAKHIGFPVKHLRLIDEDGQEPQGNAKPRGNRVYELLPPQIEVMLPDNTKVEIDIMPKQKVGDIKDIIEDVSGIPKAKQRIFFLDSDNELVDDDIPVFKAKLAHGVKLETRLPKEITLDPPKGMGRPFTLIVDPDDTLKDVTRKAGKLIGFPAKHLRLTDEGEEPEPDSKPKGGRTYRIEPPEIEVKLPDGSKVHLDLMPKQTIQDIKELIQDEIGTPVSDQRVFFLDSDEELDDKTPVFKAKLGHGSKLEMRCPQEVILKPPKGMGRTFILIVDPDDTMKDVKRKAAKHIGFPAKDLQLVDDHDEEPDPASKPRIGVAYQMVPPKVPATLPDKSKIELEILPHRTIADLKDMIEKETGIPADRHRFFYMDREEEETAADDTPLSKTALLSGKQIEMRSPDPQQQRIKTSDGRNFFISLEPDDKPVDVKKKIAKIVGVPPSSLQLSLNDDEPIDDDFDMKRLSRGDVLCIEPNKIDVHLPDGSKIVLGILPHHTIADIKDMVENETGIPKGKQRAFFMDEASNEELDDDVPVVKKGLGLGAVLEMQEVDEPENHKVTFKTRDGRKFVLTIDPEDTVNEVKKKLREKVGLVVGTFTLDDASYDDLNDDDILLDANPSIRYGAVLIAEPPELEIEIPETGKKVKVVILPTMTVSDVKKVIEEQVPEYKTKKQRLFFLDSEEELDDDTPFVKLEIEKGIPLEVRPCRITVKHWNGDAVAFIVETTEYVGDLKDKISDSFDIPYDQQRLVFEGKPVRDDLALGEQGIGDKSILQLKPMSITIVEEKGRNHELLVELTDYIGQLKGILVEKTSVPLELQCIMSGGKELQDHESLEDAGVSHGDSLSLEVFKISVMKWTGENFDVPSIKPTDTISKLKALIQKITGIPKSSQELLLNEISLDDEETLEDEEVRHRSILVLVDPNDGDINIPKQDLLSLNVMKKKKFGAIEEDVWPVIPDWKNRIFFFDNDETFSGLVEITVINWTGKTFILRDVPLRETVRQTQERIFILKQIPIAKQHITFEGKKLDPQKTLRQQMVKDKSVLVLEGKNETNLELPDADKLSFGFLPNKITGTISVNIEHWNGEISRLDNVQPTDYIDDLKDLIEKKMHIPVDHQRLLLQGNPVDDGDNLRDQKIGDGTTLALEPMKITVVAPGGKHHTLVVDFKDMVKKVKSKMYKKTGIDRKNQCLLSGGNELSNEKTLADYDIEHQDTLILEAFKIRIMHWSGEVFELQRIHRTHKLKAIKTEILNLRHISTKKQRLLYRGKELDKKMTLEEQGIEHKSILMLQKVEKESKDDKGNRSRARSGSPLGRPKISFMSGFGTPAFPKTDDPFKLQIRHWNGESFEIDSNPLEYPDDLKDKIEEVKGIPVDQLRFLYNGYFVHDDKTLQEQGIGNGEVLDLEKMRITVEVPAGHTYHFEVELDDTIRRIKNLVAKKAGSIYLEDFCIVLGGKELAESNTLAECGIEHGDAVALEMFKISVMHWAGEMFELPSARPGHTLDKVKGLILKSRLIPKEKQRLSFEGRELNDKKTLRDERIQHKSILVLEQIAKNLELPEAEKFKLNMFPTAGEATKLSYKVSIRHWNGHIFEIDTDPLEYPDDVKDKIRKAKGVKFEELRLMYQGKHLRDEATLQDQNIPSGAILDLERMKVMVNLPGGKKSQFEVELDDTIRILKKSVAKKRKLEMDDICVVVAGKELDDGSTIEENGIHHNDVVNVELYKISMIYGSGKKFDLESVRPSFTLDEVKKEISRIERLPKERQRLLLEGRELSDKKTLRDQSVHHRSVLILEEVMVAEDDKRTEKFKLSTFSTQIPQRDAPTRNPEGGPGNGGEGIVSRSASNGSDEEIVTKLEKKLPKKKSPKRNPSKVSPKSVSKPKPTGPKEDDGSSGERPKVRKKIPPGRTKSLQKPQTTQAKSAAKVKSLSRSKSESQKVPKLTGSKTQKVESKLKKPKKKLRS